METVPRQPNAYVLEGTVVIHARRPERLGREVVAALVEGLPGASEPVEPDDMVAGTMAQPVAIPEQNAG
jgi:hypothetical protein